MNTTTIILSCLLAISCCLCSAQEFLDFSSYVEKTTMKKDEIQLDQVVRYFAGQIKAGNIVAYRSSSVQADGKNYKPLTISEFDFIYNPAWIDSFIQVDPVSGTEKIVAEKHESEIEKLRFISSTIFDQSSMTMKSSISQIDFLKAIRDISSKTILAYNTVFFIKLNQ